MHRPVLPPSLLCISALVQLSLLAPPPGRAKAKPLVSMGEWAGRGSEGRASRGKARVLVPRLLESLVCWATRVLLFIYFSKHFF